MTVKLLNYINPLTIVGVYAVWRAWHIASTSEVEMVSEMAIVYLLVVCSFPALLANYYLQRAVQKVFLRFMLNVLCACAFLALTIGFF